jgi:hypothetical protein
MALVMNLLLGSTFQQSFQPLQISQVTLANYFTAKTNSFLVSSTRGEASTPAFRNEVAVPAPWENPRALEREDIVRRIMSTGSFVDTRASEFSRLDAPADHRQLFALHEGLSRLAALAETAALKDTSDVFRARYDKRFQEGFSQVSEALAAFKFEGLSVIAGPKVASVETAIAIPRAASVYKTDSVHNGPIGDEVAAFMGDVRFTIEAKKFSGAIVSADIDLADMSATPRTFDNVLAHINDALDHAGIAAEFGRYKVGNVDENGIIPGTNFGFSIQTIEAEVISFKPPSGEGAPALYAFGASGGGADLANEAGQITTLTSLSSVDGPAVSSSRRVESLDTANGALRFVSARADDQNNLYALAEVKGAAHGAHITDGGQNLVLNKYDTQGQLIWSRVVGQGDMEGADLSVANGRVAIVGSVAGVLGDTIDLGARDGFVSVFSDLGENLWSGRMGSMFEDTIDAVALADDGSVVVSGSTLGTLAGQASSGGRDVFVQRFDASGGLVWRSQFGSTLADRAGAILLDDNGDVLVASNEDGTGIVRRLSGQDGAEDPTGVVTLGTLDNGAISALTRDAATGDLYVGGHVGSAGSLDQALNTAQGEGDGFVARLTRDIATGALNLDYSRYLGSTARDSVADIQFSDGKLWVSGTTRGEVEAGNGANGTDSLVMQLDAADGSTGWARQIKGRAGRSESAALAFVPTGDSALHRLGLPMGAIGIADSDAIDQRTAAKAGDHFFLVVDGGRNQKITLKEGQSLRQLALDVHFRILQKGEAKFATSTLGNKLRIQPLEGHRIDLLPGADGADLLKSLGLRQGQVERRALDDDGREIGPPRYALDLPSSASITDPERADELARTFNGAAAILRRAYRTLIGSDPLAGLADQKPIGPPPAYLTAQIARYQDALARLGG